MRFFVKAVEDVESGRRKAGGLARIDDAGRVEVYSASLAQWVPAFESIEADIAARRGWSPLADGDADAVAQALVDALAARAGTGTALGHWLSLRPDQPHVLIRTADGRSVQGYAVSSGRWEPMDVATGPALADPAVWQPVPDEQVPEVQSWLHVLWEVKLRNDFDAQAPELVDPDLTEVALREGIVYYVIEILKRLPDGLVVGFQAPGLKPGSCGSGPLGPGGAWNFQTSYRVWGYPVGANDAVFDAVKALFDAWGWTYGYERIRPDDRVVRARTSADPKRSFDVVVSRFPHGGISMRWTTPYYPGEHADRDTTRMRMPSEITKDGIRSWKPPVY